MGSNLNIKYGQKTGTGNILKSQNNPGVTPGNIYAAENSAGEIEMYIDTPKNSGSERKRLDPRIYVGETPSGGVNAVWDNYDVWIDTSGNPTGNATPSITNNGTTTPATSGLMSATTIQGLADTLTQLKKLRLQIVSQGYWDTNTNAFSAGGSGDKTGLLTIVLPNSAVPNGQNQNTYKFVDMIDFNGINITP